MHPNTDQAFMLVVVISAPVVGYLRWRRYRNALGAGAASGPTSAPMRLLGLACVALTIGCAGKLLLAFGVVVDTADMIGARLAGAALVFSACIVLCLILNSWVSTFRKRGLAALLTIRGGD